MDADCRHRLFLLRWIATCLLVVFCSTANAASRRTQNFIIQAPTPQLAEAVAEAAEHYRRDLAMHWLGKTLPPWPRPCPIRVVSGPRLAAQGVTTYNPAPVRDFQMEVIGTPQRILDSVLPHEITHTILATHFGRPLPRWADEGICTTVEHSAERKKHEAKLQQFLRSRRGIAMNQLFLLKEYPNDVLPMYAQGYSVCRFLISQQGPRTFINFLESYMRNPSWTDNIRQHYGYSSLAELQQYWLAWVSEGCGEVTRYAKTQPRLASEQLAANVESVGKDDREINIPKNNSPTNVILAGGPSNTYTNIVRAAQNQTTQMDLQSPAVNQPAWNASTAQVIPDEAASATLADGTLQTSLGTTTPITNLTAIRNISSSPNRPEPTVLPQTATEAIKGHYQSQQRQAEAIRQSRGDTGLSQVTIPMVPPSIRFSGKYGMNPATAAAAFDPPHRLGQAKPLGPPGKAGQNNSTAGSGAIPKPKTLVPQFSPAETYQTAHPQPEQQISPGGQAVTPDSPSPSQHSRLGTPRRY